MQSNKEYIKKYIGNSFQNEQQSNSAVWLITLADLLSLMLTFFIMSFAMTALQQSQWDEVSKSFSMTFNSDRIVKTTAKPTKLGITSINVEQGLDLKYLKAIFENKFKPNQELLNKLTFIESPDKLTILINDKDLFENGIADLSDNSAVITKNIGELLSQINNRIEVHAYVSGKVDNSGKYPSAWELYLTRAARVSEEIQKYGNLSRIDSFVSINENQENKANIAIEIGNDYAQPLE